MSTKPVIPCTPANKRPALDSTDESRSPSPLSPTPAGRNSDDNVFTAGLGAGLPGALPGGVLFGPAVISANGTGATATRAAQNTGVPVIRIPARVPAVVRDAESASGGALVTSGPVEVNVGEGMESGGAAVPPGTAAAVVTLEATGAGVAVGGMVASASVGTVASDVQT